MKLVYFRWGYNSNKIKVDLDFEAIGRFCTSLLSSFSFWSGDKTRQRSISILLIIIRQDAEMSDFLSAVKSTNREVVPIDYTIGRKLTSFVLFSIREKVRRGDVAIRAVAQVTTRISDNVVPWNPFYEKFFDVLPIPSAIKVINPTNFFNYETRIFSAVGFS